MKSSNQVEIEIRVQLLQYNLLQTYPQQCVDFFSICVLFDFKNAVCEGGVDERNTYSKPCTQEACRDQCMVAEGLPFKCVTAAEARDATIQFAFELRENERDCCC